MRATLHIAHCSHPCSDQEVVVGTTPWFRPASTMYLKPIHMQLAINFCLMIGHFAMKFLVKGTPLRACCCAVSHQASAGSAHDLHRTPHVLLEARYHTKHVIGRSKEVATRSMDGKHTSDIAVYSRYVFV